MSRLTPLALTVAQAKRSVAPALGHADHGPPPGLVDARAARDSARAAVREPSRHAAPREANAAMETLAPFVRETAQRIHGRYYALKRQSAQDFVQMSPALIWSRIDHFEDWYYRELPANVRAQGAVEGGEGSKDFFAAWCYRELNFRYLDFGRAARAQPKAVALDSTADLADTRAAVDAPSVYDFSLSEGEARSLRDWDPLDGVILFCLAGQWTQVPQSVWADWLEELGLRQPFPPGEFVDAPRPRKRMRLAEALQVSRDVIFQRWHRLKKKYLS